MENNQQRPSGVRLFASVQAPGPFRNANAIARIPEKEKLTKKAPRQSGPPEGKSGHPEKQDALIYNRTPALLERPARQKKRCPETEHLYLLEGSIGIEPMHSGFADQSLTTWARPHNVPKLYQISRSMSSEIPGNHQIFCIKINENK